MSKSTFLLTLALMSSFAGIAAADNGVPMEFSDIKVKVPCEPEAQATAGASESPARKKCMFGFDSCKDVKKQSIEQLDKFVEMKIDFYYKGVNVDWRDPLATRENPIGEQFGSGRVCNIQKDDGTEACATSGLTRFNSSGMVYRPDHGIGTTNQAMWNGTKTQAVQCYADAVKHEIRQGTLSVTPACRAVAEELNKFITKTEDQFGDVHKIQSEHFDKAVYNMCDTQDLQQTKKEVVADVCKAEAGNIADMSVRRHFMTACYTKSAAQYLQGAFAYLAICETMARAQMGSDTFFIGEDGQRSIYQNEYLAYSKPLIDRSVGRHGCKSRSCAKRRSAAKGTENHHRHFKPWYKGIQEKYFAVGKCRQPSEGATFSQAGEAQEREIIDHALGVASRHDSTPPVQKGNPLGLLSLFGGLLGFPRRRHKKDRNAHNLPQIWNEKRITQKLFAVAFPTYLAFALGCGGGGGGSYRIDLPPDPRQNKNDFQMDTTLDTTNAADRAAQAMQLAAANLSGNDAQHSLAATAPLEDFTDGKLAAVDAKNKDANLLKAAGQKLAGNSRSGGGAGAGRASGLPSDPGISTAGAARNEGEPGETYLENEDQAGRGGYSAGGGNGSGSGSAAAKAGSSFADLFKKSDDGMSGNAPQELDFGGRDANGFPTSLSADPEDYFARIGVYESIFKIVEKRYRTKSIQWWKIDANRSLASELPPINEGKLH